jgi:hypothetical protein
MGDTISPPPSGDRNDTGPVQGSEEWFTVQEHSAKRKAFGAGIGFVAEEKIRYFVFEMSFAHKPGVMTPTINIYAPHQQFIAKLLAVTDAHVMPTKKSREPNDATTSTKSPIISADAFPKTTYLHEQFFERNIYYNEKTKRTIVKIMHQVLMKEQIHKVKHKMMDFLKSNGMWLKNGDLDAVETSGFGWLYRAHDAMVHRPTLKILITKLLLALPTAAVNKAIKDYGSPDDLENLPEIFLNPKWQKVRERTETCADPCGHGLLRQE